MDPKTLRVLGSIPGSVCIVCKNEATATLIQSFLHHHVAFEPPVIVAPDWPESVSDDALVVTPLKVLGQTDESDFSINIYAELSEKGKHVLNTAMRMASAGQTSLSIRNIATAAAISPRHADYGIQELVRAGLAMRSGDKKPIRLLFGRWRPDAAAAKMAGIDIKEYK